MQTSKINIVISYYLASLFIARAVDALGRPAGPASNAGEYGPENPPKPYAFNYEIVDKQGNVHFRKEERDPSGNIMGSYGYMKIDGLYRTVEYIANGEGYKAMVKTNEPGTKGPGSADVIVLADPVPMAIMKAFENKVQENGIKVTPMAIPSLPGMKG